MKKLQKGFTLVELIVVITILAILGTIAFISLQGYSQDAKNSKVSSDLSTLASAIEISNTNGSTNVRTILDNTKNVLVAPFTGGTFGSSISWTGLFVTGSVMADGTTYGVGGVNFSGLQQNGADFKDSSATPRDYVYAYGAEGEFAYYQIAGQITEASGSDTVYVKGNYVLAAASGALSDRFGLVQGTTLATGSGSSTGALSNGTSGVIRGY